MQPGLSQIGVTDPTDVSLRHLLGEILAPYAQASLAKVVLEGSDAVRVSANATTGMALVLHELATNAAKYGPLGQSDGQLVVTWTLSDVLELVWSEQGGPAVVPPTRAGFGSRLTKRTVEGQFQGTISYSWDPTGLNVTMTLPAAKLN